MALISTTVFLLFDSPKIVTVCDFVYLSAHSRCGNSPYDRDGGVIEDGATFLRERTDEMINDDIADDRRKRISALLHS